MADDCFRVGVAARRETIHAMLRRLTGWDYKGRAIYQITVVLKDCAHAALGRLDVRRGGSAEARGQQPWLTIAEARGLKLAPEEIEARVVPSAWGLAALEALDEMSRRYPNVEILARQLMPDHLHFVVFVKSPLDRPLGALVRGFKAGATKRWLALAGNSPENGRARNGGESSVPARSRDGLSPARFCAGHPQWAEGFQDTVLLHEGQLDNMKRYLADNPRRLAVRRLFPDLFKVAREIALPLAWPPRRAIGHFSALGNRDLLARPLVQVQVSRRDFGYRRIPKPGGGLKIARDETGAPVVAFATPAFDEKRDALLAAGRHGAVLVSPCVSDGERQIARAAFEAELPLVAMRNEGFTPREKPVVRAFDACAEGRLLLLAPAGWGATRREMTRFDAVAMNRLCQGLVGKDAAEINYHGMKPANIDALARDAALLEEQT